MHANNCIQQAQDLSRRIETLDTLFTHAVTVLMSSPISSHSSVPAFLSRAEYLYMLDHQALEKAQVCVDDIHAQLQQSNSATTTATATATVSCAFAFAYATQGLLAITTPHVLEDLFVLSEFLWAQHIFKLMRSENSTQRALGCGLLDLCGHCDCFFGTPRKIALMHACHMGHEDVVNRLLQHEWHVLDDACHMGHGDVVSTSKFPVHAKCNTASVAKDARQRLESLLDEDSRLDTPTDANVDRLIALATPEWKARRRQVMGPRRVNAVAHDNYAIRWAARNGHAGVVRALLGARFERDIHDEFVVNPAARDNSALRGAAESGHLDVVETLLSISTSIDPAAHNNRALRLAEANNHERVVTRLLFDPRVAKIETRKHQQLKWDRRVSGVAGAVVGSLNGAAHAFLIACAARIAATITLNFGLTLGLVTFMALSGAVIASLAMAICVMLVVAHRFIARYCNHAQWSRESLIYMAGTTITTLNVAASAFTWAAFVCVVYSLVCTARCILGDPGLGLGLGLGLDPCSCPSLGDPAASASIGGVLGMAVGARVGWTVSWSKIELIRVRDTFI